MICNLPTTSSSFNLSGELSAGTTFTRLPQNHLKSSTKRRTNHQSTREQVYDIIHIQTVNNHHSQFKDYLHRLHDVSIFNQVSRKLSALVFVSCLAKLTPGLPLLPPQNRESRRIIRKRAFVIQKSLPGSMSPDRAAEHAGPDPVPAVCHKSRQSAFC